MRLALPANLRPPADAPGGMTHGTRRAIRWSTAIGIVPANFLDPPAALPASHSSPNPFGYEILIQVGSHCREGVSAAHPRNWRGGKSPGGWRPHPEEVLWPARDGDFHLGLAGAGIASRFGEASSRKALRIGPTHINDRRWPRSPIHDSSGRYGKPPAAKKHPIFKGDSRRRSQWRWQFVTRLLGFFVGRSRRIPW